VHFDRVGPEGQQAYAVISRMLQNRREDVLLRAVSTDQSARPSIDAIGNRRQRGGIQVQ
jgi:hypothetical protein